MNRRELVAAALALPLLPGAAGAAGPRWPRGAVDLRMADLDRNMWEGCRAAVDAWSVPGLPLTFTMSGGGTRRPHPGEIAVVYGEGASWGRTWAERGRIVRGKMSLWPDADPTVFMHELGHVLGLDHCTCEDSIMGPNPSSYPGPSQRDLAVLARRYGVPGWPEPGACPGRGKRGRRH